MRLTKKLFSSIDALKLNLFFPFLYSRLSSWKKTLANITHMSQATYITKVIMISVTDLTMMMCTQNGRVRCKPFQRQYNSLFRLKLAVEECHSKVKWTNLRLSSDVESSLGS